MGSADDRDLVRALREGTREGFAAMYDRYHERVWGFVARLVASREEAEDVFQDTWLSAAAHAVRLRPDSELLPWLLRIARNKAGSRWRFLSFDRERKRRLAREPLAPVPTPDEAASLRREVDAAERALAALRASHREVLLLCAVEGLDAEQAGVVLDLRADAVRQRLSRARRALAEELGRVQDLGMTPEMCERARGAKE